MKNLRDDVKRRDVELVLAKKETGSGALYLEQREVFKNMLNEYFR